MLSGRILPRVVLVLLALAVAPWAVVAADEDAAARIYVSNEYGGSITVVDTTTDKVIDTIHVSEPGDRVRPRGMAVSPDGRTIYVAISDFHPQVESRDDRIVAIDVASNDIIKTFYIGSNPERLGVSPDGTQLWASNEDAARATGFDLEEGEELGTFHTGIEPEGVGVSPDGRWVYVTGETSHTITVIDTEKMEVAKNFLVSQRPRYVIFSHVGNTAYVSGEIGGGISVIDTADHSVVDTIELGLDARPIQMVLSPDEKQLYVVGGGTSSVYVIDTDSREVVEVIHERMGRRPWGIAMTPDGKKLYTANGLSDSISIIHSDCLCVKGEIEAGRGPHTAVTGIVPVASD